MKIEHLRTFTVVAEDLHFGRAAARLFIAQPAVSQHIKLLEKDLGVRLFDRSTRAVRLSDRGRAFYDHAVKILDEVDKAEAAAKHGHAHIVGRVELGFSSMSSQRVVPQLIRTLEEREPGVELNLQGVNRGNGLLREVAIGNLDMGIARLPIREPELDWHVYEYQPLVVAMKEDSELAAAEALDLSDLKGQTLIAFPAGSGSSVREATLKTGLEFGVTFPVIREAPDTMSSLNLIAAGFGIAVTVSQVQRFPVPGVAFRPLKGDVPQMAAALFWKRDNPSEALHAVIRAIRDTLPIPSKPRGRVFGA